MTQLNYLKLFINYLYDFHHAYINLSCDSIIEFKICIVKAGLYTPFRRVVDDKRNIFQNSIFQIIKTSRERVQIDEN